jgi:hypothetical protein
MDLIHLAPYFLTQLHILEKKKKKHTHTHKIKLKDMKFLLEVEFGSEIDILSHLLRHLISRTDTETYSL